MKVYIAGPMQGYKDFNFPTFNKVAKMYRTEGWVVCNPAEKDIENHGEDAYKSETGNIVEAEKKGFSLRDALKYDLSWIADNADAVCMLPGWERSYGAKAEHALAVALKLDIHYLEQRVLETL